MTITEFYEQRKKKCLEAIQHITENERKKGNPNPKKMAYDMTGYSLDQEIDKRNQDYDFYDNICHRNIEKGIQNSYCPLDTYDPENPVLCKDCKLTQLMNKCSEEHECLLKIFNEIIAPNIESICRVCGVDRNKENNNFVASGTICVDCHKIMIDKAEKRLRENLRKIIKEEENELYEFTYRNN